MDAFTRTSAELTSTYAVVAARDVLAAVGREPGIRRVEARARKDLKGPIVVKDPAVLVAVVSEAPAYPIAAVVDPMGNRRFVRRPRGDAPIIRQARKAGRGRIEVGKVPRRGAEIRVVVASGIDPATDDLTLIIDARRVGEDSAGVLELEIGSVRVSQKTVRRAVAIPG